MKTYESLSNEQFFSIYSAATFRSPNKVWSEEDFLLFLKLSGTFPFALIKPNESILISRILYEKSEIILLEVKEESRRKGCASVLIEQFAYRSTCLGAKDIFLEVAISNTNAINLYIKLGFSKVGLRKNYYFKDSQKEDAYIMRLNLI